MDRLGNTLAEVAANKAGIIKRGAPVVTAAPGSGGNVSCDGQSER